MADTVIIDYGAGNLRSVARAVAHAGYDAEIRSDPGAIEGTRALILPGVGAAADTMANLRAAGLVDPLREYIDADRPFLGVCMGMQALFDVSEEGGQHACLGLLPGRIVRFPDGLTIPHMGWNTLRMVRPHPVLEGVEDGTYAYFVHSYHPQPDDPALVAQPGRGQVTETRAPGIILVSCLKSLRCSALHGQQPLSSSSINARGG